MYEPIDSPNNRNGSWTWGPVRTENIVSTRDRLTKLCDFVGMFSQRTNTQGVRGNAGKRNKTDNHRKEDNEYAMVDAAPKPNPHPQKYQKKNQNNRRNFQQLDFTTAYEALKSGETVKRGGFRPGGPMGRMAGGKPSGVRNQGKAPARKGRGKGMQRRFMNFNQQSKGIQEWTIPVAESFEHLLDIDLNALRQFEVDPEKIQKKDIVWAGSVYKYDPAMDKVSHKKGQRLKTADNILRTPPNSASDPVFDSLLKGDLDELTPEEADHVQVVGTDCVIAALGCARTSNYPFHIVISRNENTLIFENREDSGMNVMTVRETAMEPPATDNKDRPQNRPKDLGEEITKLNHNFAHQVLSADEAPRNFDYDNPFDDEDFLDEGEQPAKSAFRYQLVTVQGLESKKKQHVSLTPTQILIRSEISFEMPTTGKKPIYGMARACLEYDNSGSTDWRRQFATQASVVFNDEIRNNRYRYNRWLAEAVIGGCDVMKIGYASRRDMKNPGPHDILAVQTTSVPIEATTYEINESQIYGAVKFIADYILSRVEEDEVEFSRYALVKSPNKPQLHLYKIPFDYFESLEQNQDKEDSEDDRDEEEMWPEEY